MRILVIGGSGFIGPDVLKQLNAKGHEVILFNDGRLQVDVSSCKEHVVGDLKRFPEYKEVFKRLAPEIVLEDMFHFSREDAYAVINTLKGIAHRIVAISGTDVYRAYGMLFGMEAGNLEPVPLTEESTLRVNTFPGMEENDKLTVEKAIMSDPDMPGTILRLPPVYGPRSQMHRMYFYLKRMDDKRPAIALSNDMATWRWSHGYVENIAAAIAMAATDERATGRIYNLSDTESTSTIEWVLKIAKAADWDGEVVVVSDTRLVEVSPFALMKINAYQDITVDSTLIREELGYTEHVSGEEALMQTVAWERLNPIPPYYLNPDFFNYAIEDTILHDVKSRSDNYH